MARITRKPGWIGYTVAAEGSAEVIKMSELSGGSIEVTGAVTIEIYACNKEDPTGETFVVAYDSDGNAMTVVAAGAGVWSLPAGVFNLSFIKLVDTGGAAVNVFLKG